jgi:hypothetical protein
MGMSLFWLGHSSSTASHVDGVVQREQFELWDGCISDDMEISRAGSSSGDIFWGT